MKTTQIKVTTRFLATMFATVDGDICTGKSTAFAPDTEVKIVRSVKVRVGRKKEPRYLVSTERGGETFFGWFDAHNLNSERVS